MIRTALLLPLAAIALAAGGVSLVAWGIACPEPRRELYGSGSGWVKRVVRGWG